ncbi:MAG TPA: hypothetical protein VOA87_04985 [Thermoanaerobaculia bacterium]|nr:hypothetical protein [Thermoanaerobaculia bacterium]
MLSSQVTGAGSPALFARGKRGSPVRRPPRQAAAPTAATPAAPWSSRVRLLKLAGAGLLVFLFFAASRLAAPQAWSYDEYYHLGVARELAHHFPLRAFPWTPFSVLADHYADKELLFHLVLLPLSGLPVDTAGTVGALLGQAFFVFAFAWALWRLRVPGAHWFLLGLVLVGPMFAFRVAMCRPHVWMVGFTLLVLGLLLERPEPGSSYRLGRFRAAALFAVAALFGLVHTAGWLSIPFAALFAVAGWLGADPEDRRFLWRPLALAAGGWLLGQLVHPNFPENFRLAYLQNVVVPLQSAGAGSAALAATAGAELTAPGASVLAEQWPAFLAPAVVAFGLLRQPRLRTRATVTAAILAAIFLLAGALFFQRMFEVGAPLGLLALALAAAERRRQGLPALLPGWEPFVVALALALGGLWTFAIGRAHAPGISYPQEMARWMGENAKAGTRVFTAQWGDSAPLFWFAPRLQSLVALDPTFFYVKDPALFAEYADLAYGRRTAPVDEIERRFGCRYATVWRAPLYAALAGQLAADPRSKLVYADGYYLVFELRP